MFQENVQVLWNENVGPSYYRIGLTCHQGYATAKPGQFIMLRLPDQMVPLLRRPFSIHRIINTDGSTTGLELLYKVVGEGTKKLSRCRQGDIVDILGPLGNGFSFFDRYKQIAVVAGGIGVAPLLFLVSTLRTKGVDLSKSTVFIGGRSMQDLLCRDDFSRLGINVRITTDDGSAGDQCFVTHPLEIAMEKQRADIIYACGPQAMLKCVIGIAEKHRLPCQISIETIMACGMGVCLGCTVEKKGDPFKYMHACMDGPVFDAGIIKI
ncbi:MAG: dihydroorotate dehydrogenase electron transfer subunit [Pseudomonadota bacterium]